VCKDPNRSNELESPLYYLHRDGQTGIIRFLLISNGIFKDGLGFSSHER
jgi:hypothetical protein